MRLFLVLRSENFWSKSSCAFFAFFLAFFCFWVWRFFVFWLAIFLFLGWRCFVFWCWQFFFWSWCFFCFWSWRFFCFWVWRFFVFGLAFFCFFVWRFFVFGLAFFCFWVWRFFVFGLAVFARRSWCSGFLVLCMLDVRFLFYKHYVEVEVIQTRSIHKRGDDLLFSKKKRESPTIVRPRRLEPKKHGH